MFMQTIIQVNFPNGMVDMRVKFYPNFIKKKKKFKKKFNLENRRQTN